MSQSQDNVPQAEAVYLLSQSAQSTCLLVGHTCLNAECVFNSKFCLQNLFSRISISCHVVKSERQNVMHIDELNFCMGCVFSSRNCCCCNIYYVLPNCKTLQSSFQKNFSILELPNTLQYLGVPSLLQLLLSSFDEITQEIMKA